MSTTIEKKAALVLSPEYLKKAGIELDNSATAAAAARSRLMTANHGRGYIPQNAASDTVVKVMDFVQQEIAAGDTATRNVCVALASVDLSRAFETANDANGKPYTSMLSFAMDLLPDLAKSTVAGYLSVGRNIYVPAINKRFGASSSILFELPPSTLDALKANLANDNTRGDTIEAIKAASKGGAKVSQKLAKSIARVVRDRASMDNKPAMTATELVKAAKGDSAAAAKIYGAPESKPAGATRNGGNAESASSGNSDEYNAVKALMKTYITTESNKVIDERNVETTVTTISMDAQTLSSFCGALRKIMLAPNSNAARYACRAIAEILDGADK